MTSLGWQGSEITGYIVGLGTITGGGDTNAADFYQDVSPKSTTGVGTQATFTVYRDTEGVRKAWITRPGMGYTSTPRVTFHGGQGSGAYATAQITDAAIGIVTITSGGSGYISIPTVTVVAPGIGSTTIDAIVTARLSGLGTISELVIEDAGGYFESVPQIIIGSPNNNVGYGTYLTNEDVVGAASSATGRVNSWNKVTQILKLKDIVGEFSPGEAIIGQSSGATYKSIDLNRFDIPEDGYAQNVTIEQEADAILDFSESNPFGSP